MSSELLKTEITLLKKDLEDKTITLDEMFKLNDDKQKEVDKLQRIIDEQGKEVSRLKEDCSGYKLRVDELEAIIRQNIQEKGFRSASELPKMLYVRAGECYAFYKELLKASIEATSHNNYWRKVEFDSEPDGRLVIKGLEKRIV
jgi:hypothetical protein